MRSRGIEVNFRCFISSGSAPERLVSVNDCRGPFNKLTEDGHGNLLAPVFNADVYCSLSSYVKSQLHLAFCQANVWTELVLFFSCIIILVNKSRAHSLLCPACSLSRRVISSRYNYLSAPTPTAWNFLSMFKKWKSRGNAPWRGEII